MSKKIISVLLAVVMVLAMGTVALVSVSADLADLPEQPAGTKRYFFYMPDKWMNDYAYTAGIYWWEGTDAHSAWPGIEANKADVEGVYYYDVPEDVTTIVWNNYVDGGTDPSLPIYQAAIQTKNIGTEYYDPGESEVYPDGTDTFDGMIYVTDLAKTEEQFYSKKLTYIGEWYYYYGNGEYGVTPDKADAPEVYTDYAFNSHLDLVVDPGPSTSGDESTPTGTTEAPTATEAATTEAATTVAPTTAEPTTAEPVAEATITVAGETYTARVGDKITYTMDVTAARLFENIQATISYDSAVLELTRYTSDDPDVEDWEVEGPIACPNLDGVIFNAGIDGIVKLNASKVAGYNFKEEAALVTLEFTVVAEGETSIDAVIEEMTIKGGEESYFAGGEAVTTEGISVVETLVVPEPPVPTTVPTTAAPTTVAPTPAPTTAKPTAPVVAPTTSAVEPTEADPTEAPTAEPDASATVDTTEDKADNDTVKTGAAAYIYVVLAVLAMASCAVVVLRKRANG